MSEQEAPPEAAHAATPAAASSIRSEPKPFERDAQSQGISLAASPLLGPVGRTLDSTVALVVEGAARLHVPPLLLGAGVVGLLSGCLLANAYVCLSLGARILRRPTSLRQRRKTARQPVSMPVGMSESSRQRSRQMGGWSQALAHRRIPTNGQRMPEFIPEDCQSLRPSPRGGNESWVWNASMDTMVDYGGSYHGDCDAMLLDRIAAEHEMGGSRLGGSGTSVKVSALPEGWVMVACGDGSGRSYFWNQRTNETRWELPAAAWCSSMPISSPPPPVASMATPLTFDQRRPQGMEAGGRGASMSAAPPPQAPPGLSSCERLAQALESRAF